MAPRQNQQPLVLDLPPGREARRATLIRRLVGTGEVLEALVAGVADGSIAGALVVCCSCLVGGEGVCVSRQMGSGCFRSLFVCVMILLTYTPTSTQQCSGPVLGGRASCHDDPGPRPAHGPCLALPCPALVSHTPLFIYSCET